MVVLLTQIDQIPNGNHGNRDVFYNEAIRDLVRIITTKLRHIPLNRIFPVKNYDSEYLINIEASTLILLAFREILRLCERHVMAKYCCLYKTQNTNSWKKNIYEYLPESTKHRLISLMTIIILLCIVILRPAIIWRKSVVAILFSSIGDWCFFTGWVHTYHIHDLFGEGHDDHGEGEAHEEEDPDDYYV